MGRPGKRKKTSRFLGVHTTGYVGRPWTAQVRFGDLERASLGAWKTEDEAALAYDRAVLHYRGPNARRNFPNRKVEPADGATLQTEARRHCKDLTSSRFLGVIKDVPSWRAEIRRPGAKVARLGQWPTEDEAALAYDRGARYLSLDRRLLNFPERKLRPASPGDLRTQARISRKNRRATSRYHGVFFQPAATWRPWLAQLSVNGHSAKHLGTWATEEDAGRAYDRAALYYLGRRGPNFPHERGAAADAKTLAAEARKEGKLARTSRFLGVSWNPANSQWRAQIQQHARHFFLGEFDREREAAAAYDSKSIALRGVHAAVNFHPETGAHVWGRRLIDLHLPSRLLRGVARRPKTANQKRT